MWCKRTLEKEYKELDKLIENLDSGQTDGMNFINGARAMLFWILGEKISKPSKLVKEKYKYEIVKEKK